MLITCPECSLQISNQAAFCPHCGLPFTLHKRERVSNRRKKLPNGFGGISFIKGNLRKPYRATITIGFNADGKPITQILKPVGYFKTYNEAYTALLENIKNPYDVNKDITLKELYEEWIAIKAKTESEGNIRHYRQGFINIPAIHEMKIRDIKPKVIRSEIEKHQDSASTPKRIKVLLNLLFDYAVENEIVEKNYARETKINTSTENENTKHHISFTDEEISTLWQHTDDKTVRMILIQCYTGFRPGELVSLTPENIFLDENYIIGGSKTEAGRNRKVPIHPAIKSFVNVFLKNATEKNWKYLFQNSMSLKVRTETYRYAFKNIVNIYKLNPEHRCHDPRKFFITQAKANGLNEYAIKLIVGHAITDITEKIYTERSFDWLYEEMLKIKIS